MMRAASSWSRLPHSPNIIVPRQWVLTWMPVAPIVRYSISLLSRPWVDPGGRCPPGSTHHGANARWDDPRVLRRFTGQPSGTFGEDGQHRGGDGGDPVVETERGPCRGHRPERADRCPPGHGR